MNYDTAKKLKDAGFPQEQGIDGGRFEENEVGGQNDVRMIEIVYIPTLSELIDACGKDFKSLLNFNGESNATWQAEAHNFKGHGQGNTPEEAVAELWLELNK